MDQVRQDWVLSQKDHKSAILASASASLFGIFNITASYESKTGQQMLESYQKHRTSSSILTKGGPLFKPASSSADSWAAEVDRLVQRLFGRLFVCCSVLLAPCPYFYDRAEKA